MEPETIPVEQTDFDFIIIGSGAGGAPLAARLAEAGRRVLVIEAGPNQAAAPATEGSHEVSRVPVLHAASTEHPDLAWRYFVRHYRSRPPGVAQDSKWQDVTGDENDDHPQQGIFYPRASGVGGCTIHNAMITVLGPDADWDELADFLKDPSWRASAMQTWFRSLEHNDYLPRPQHARRSRLGRTWTWVRNATRWLFGWQPNNAWGQHGYSGWLHTSVADVSLGLGDRQLKKMLKAALKHSSAEGLDRGSEWVNAFLRGRVRQELDPNHDRTRARSPEGVTLIPVSVYGEGSTIHQDRSLPFAMRGRRSSPRELLAATLASCPGRLEIRTDCLVTRLVFEDDITGQPPHPETPPRIVGVELQEGERLYRAHVSPAEADGERKRVLVAPGGEVIVSAGAFNTPQLLMLSGIGDRDEVERFTDTSDDGSETPTIRCRVHLPGVGRNLQDRYEVSVVSEMEQEFALLQGATLALPDDPDQPDPHLRHWRREGTGLYASNGGVLAILKRSRPDLARPDLFIFGVPLSFRGYEPGYSRPTDHKHFSWIILKSQTRNHDGRVRLRSVDPRDTPLVNFHYFNEESRPGHSDSDPDLKALLHGVRFVRGILDRAGGIVASEVSPGSARESEQDLSRWIRQEAWGHHACGTCRMGPDGDPFAVLDSRFRVRGVAGLRVVDASIFPKIPGYFVVSNIYMASEKAAETILSDGTERPGNSAVYPDELRNRELAALVQRREAAEITAAPDDGGRWSSDVTGLALSGGGIRSATFCLGVLQSLADAVPRCEHTPNTKPPALRQIDFLSTVSGGGYIGCFLGRLYDVIARNDSLRSGLGQPERPTLRAERELRPESAPLHWLRRHGNYVAPQGSGGGQLNLAIFVRNLLSVHFVIGLLLFALFGVANAVRYGVLELGATLTGLVAHNGALPIGHLLESWIGPFFSPWFMLTELLLLFLVLPRITGYWVVSDRQHEAFSFPTLLMLYLVGGSLLLLGVLDGLRLQLVVVGVALFTTFAHVEFTWAAGRRREAAVGSGGPGIQRARTGNYLTYDLGMALGLVAVALLFSVVDSLGHGIQQWKVAYNQTYAQAFAVLGGLLAAGLPFARLIADQLAKPRSGPPSTVGRLLRQEMPAGLLAIVLFLLPLVLYSFAAHVAWDGGAAIGRGLLATLTAGLLSALLAAPWAIGFVNRSSLARAYAARLARAYLGASNPERRTPDGANVTEVTAGDDVSSLHDYRPYRAGGPLHLINVMVNQTVDTGSGYANRDRKGENVAASSVGVTIGRIAHAAWKPAARTAEGAPPKTLATAPLGRCPGDPHPLVSLVDEPADRVERLSLRQWMAISGAAIDPGRGSGTRLGTSLLMGLFNIRTGHWWDTGIPHADRVGFPDIGFARRLLYLSTRMAQTQSLILFEWLARFPGPWQRFWHLSDGGFFENLGGYELIRRRVPRIIICDAGADPGYEFEDLANLIRKVRIDFHARVEPLTAEEVEQAVPERLRDSVGTWDELRPQNDSESGLPGPATKHAALFRVEYDDDPCRSSILLYIKATVTGDEPADVRHYHAAHREFPHEATADQFFNESQWESYRALGEHTGVPLFCDADRDWFWRIPVQHGSPSP